MPRRHPRNVTVERERQLQRLQTAAILAIAAGVVILIYLAVATTR